MKTLVSEQITKIKDSITAFGTNAVKIGGVMHKIGNLVNATAISGTTTPAATLEAATTTEASGATGAQFKAFAEYKPHTFQVDFDNFKSQAPDCFTYYSNAIQRLACDGCKETTLAAIPNRWKSTTLTSIQINSASSAAWVAACNKVWNFMWKAGWFVQATAFLNSKKATGYTYSPLAAASAVVKTTAASATLGITAVNEALTACYPDAPAATLTTCTQTHRDNLVMAFVKIYATDAMVGRSDTTIIAGTYVSNAGRRILPVGAFDGTVSVDNTDGFDVSTGAAMFPPTAAVTLASTDTTSWSTGYVASSSTSSSSSTTGSSSSTTTKSAKVFITTILSAIFAVALLN
jgi:hypothetical protein